MYNEGIFLSGLDHIPSYACGSFFLRSKGRNGIGLDISFDMEVALCPWRDMEGIFWVYVIRGSMQKGVCAKDFIDSFDTSIDGNGDIEEALMGFYDIGIHGVIRLAVGLFSWWYFEYLVGLRGQVRYFFLAG